MDSLRFVELQEHTKTPEQCTTAFNENITLISLSLQTKLETCMLPEIFITSENLNGDVVPVSGQISERARGQNLVFFLSIWKNCDSRFGTKLGNKVVKTKL